MFINRKQFLKLATASGVLFTFTPFSVLHAQLNSSISELILKAGNSNNEKERAALILKAINEPSVSVEEKEILESIFYRG
jgi:hypothetical protein